MAVAMRVSSSLSLGSAGGARGGPGLWGGGFRLVAGWGLRAAKGGGFLGVVAGGGGGCVARGGAVVVWLESRRVSRGGGRVSRPGPPRHIFNSSGLPQLDSYDAAA